MESVLGHGKGLGQDDLSGQAQTIPWGSGSGIPSIHGNIETSEQIQS